MALISGSLPPGSFSSSKILNSLALICLVVAAGVLSYEGARAEEEDYEAKCNKFNGTDCSQCAVDPKCYWCTGSKSCHYYEWNSAKTYFKYCSWGEARWQKCWLNVEALVISLSVIGGILLILLIACCCWCKGKCRARKQRRFERQERELDHREAERRERNADRRAERQTRTEEIRQKYGLKRNPDGSYRRMENEPEN